MSALHPLTPPTPDSSVHLPWETDGMVRSHPTQGIRWNQVVRAWSFAGGWGAVPWVPIPSPALKNTTNGAAQEKN